MRPRLGLEQSGTKAAYAGVVISFEAEDGARLTLHATGPLLRAVRDLCARALARDPSFRVVCVSTPASVYTDVVGRAINYAPHSDTVEKTPTFPEPMLLVRAGVPLMLHPRLRGRTDSRQKWRGCDARGQQ